MHQRRGYHVSPSKTFFHTVPKNFVGEHFSVSKKFGYRKILFIRRGYHWTPLNTFCLTVPIKFVGEHFCVAKEFWYQKFSSKGGGSFTVLSKNFLSYRTEKTSPGNHSVFQKISGRKKFLWIRGGEGGGITVFRRKFFVSLYQNISLENTLVFQKFF